MLNHEEYRLWRKSTSLESLYNVSSVTSPHIMSQEWLHVYKSQIQKAWEPMVGSNQKSTTVIKKSPSRGQNI